MNFQTPRALALCAMTALVAACSQPDMAVPQAVLPDAPEPTTFTRAYSMTENVDGTIRVFAQEDGDHTYLYEMRRSGQVWSEPAKLDFPTKISLTTPSFSFHDGMLYYASDVDLPGREGRKDLNLWRVALADGVWGTPEYLPLDIINTGANESSPAMAADGTLFFSTNHARAGGGGYDIMSARENAPGEWDVQTMPSFVNDFRVDSHLAVTPDGARLFFYSHRQPSLGSVDIWMIEADGAGSWQQPRNLGAPVNSDQIDFGAGLSGDAKTFFFSRNGRLMEVSMDAALAHVNQAPHGSTDNPAP